MEILIIIVVVMYALGSALMWEFLQETFPEECYYQPKVKKIMVVFWPFVIAASLLIHAYICWDTRKSK